MPNAVLAHYGGQELVVLLAGVNELYARSCAEVLGAAVSRLALEADGGSPLAVTVSIGNSAMIPTSAASSRNLRTQADQTLYCAKANSRNRVEHATSPGQGSGDMSTAAPSSPLDCPVSGGTNEQNMKAS
ncbi:GGDEF domain-containing protein [Agrobacterium sp. a22-2]|nr:GGDEF domain-containing protein [Agrobacterium sp. a22-2]